MSERNLHLTKSAKEVLSILKKNGPISATEVHGNRLIVLQTLRRRNLVQYKDGVFTYFEPPTDEQLRKYIRENHGKLPIKQISFNMCMSMVTLCRIKRELNLPKLPRGRGPKTTSEKPTKIKEAPAPAFERPPAEYTNDTRLDAYNRIMNTKL